jgi:hypothetical protein
VTTVAFLIACGGYQAPVPMVGQETDVSQLAGEWFGEYSSVESGRSGSITFKLIAGSDTATGDVIMSPRFNARPQTGQVQPTGPAPGTIQALTINFVRVTGGQVSGSLAPYTDPTCGCTLHTTFVGRLRADTLAGTYTSLHEQSREIQRGQWQVVRQQPTR